MSFCSISKPLTPEKYQMPFADLRAAVLQSPGCQGWCHPQHPLHTCSCIPREALSLSNTSSSQLTTREEFKAPGIPDCSCGWNTVPRRGTSFRNRQNKCKLQRSSACSRLPEYTMSKRKARWTACLQDGNDMGKEVGGTGERKGY